MISDAPDFASWFAEVEGLPRPDWKSIGNYIRSHATEDHRADAWEQITRVWLEKLRERLDRSYTLTESKNFHLMSELEPKQKDDLLSFVERARTGILHTLADIALPKRYGKHVILRFTLEEDYYRYISYFDPEGEYAGSGGIFIPGGYMHIAYWHTDISGRDRALLAHELTHNLLHSFPLPNWLGEGLAMLFERDISGGSWPSLTKELAARHQGYWNPQTIQEFWRGTSFANVEGQELAYSLSRILMDFIATDLRPAPADFRDFVIHADRKDGGQAAARNYLGVELSDLVSAFLGPGEWAPRLS